MPFSTLPPDYQDRVYGGVLGKVIGVYLGRPFEQWSHKAIMEKFGEINFYVNEQAGVPIVVADDDISGTFTFLRALEDNDFDPNLTAEQIGETWLNYIIENRTILWWGGRSTSTEHTAFLNLKNGIKAPRSGSMELNGKTVAEQIGAQIFIDGWGLIHPNDPEAAADWARRAASVSHDGEAIYGAQVIAAMVAGAFGEQDVYKLQDLALAQIPPDCQIRRLIEDVREIVARYPDWKEGFAELDRTYGYGVYTSNCHIIPNHGLIHFALLHGKGDFQHSMRVVNTCGWDTDCNAGNLGCILGVRSGPDYFESDDLNWYEPFEGKVIIPSHGCILFSQYYDTVRWFGAELAKNPSFAAQDIGLYAGSNRSGFWRAGSFQRCPRDALKARAQAGEIKLILGTDAASEGLNFQRLGALINVDLPWNPTRLEQRKGRIQRIGQLREEVWIANLRYRGSVEDRVHSLLSDRLEAIHTLFGQIPDTLKDVWVQLAENNEAKARELIERAAETQNPFDAKYSKVEDADWETCSTVLNAFSTGEMLRRPWR